MKNLFYILSIIFLTTSCYNKIDVPKGTPRCIKKHIKNNEDDVSFGLKYIINYSYEDIEEVYLFYAEKDGHPYYYLYDNKCNIICSEIPMAYPSNCEGYNIFNLEKNSIKNDTIWKRD